MNKTAQSIYDDLVTFVMRATHPWDEKDTLTALRKITKDLKKNGYESLEGKVAN